MRKEEGWATCQQPVPVELPTTTETTNKCNTAEKGKSSASFVTDSLILDPIFSPRNITRIGTWNVRPLNQIEHLAQLLQEFDNYRLDILGLSEVRWMGSGCFNSANKAILFSGCDGRRERGVGFVLNKRAANALVGWKPVNERIITARFSTKHVRITVIQVYAPTDNLEEGMKNNFYGLLQNTIDETPRRDLRRGSSVRW
ncbi:hypothetical protein Aduo_008943 [Ancylostoma duodenale]